MATGGLDDFSNNLASDLGPLLALFGDAVTKQYLSECTTWVDYLIFATAPLGLVTAVVSVIRVCGDSSLRAFIGRAQEGDGVVEAELCTSTSRDVCELFNKGGITRVLGRPKILEVMKCRSDAYRKADPADESAGLFLFRDYVSRLESDNEEWALKASGGLAASPRTPSSRGSRLWHLCIPRFLQPKKNPSSSLDPEGAHAKPAKSQKGRKVANVPFYLPSPNISLNVGIVKRSPWAFNAVALVGLCLQAGVVAAAIVLTWTLEWGKDGAPTTFISFQDVVHSNSAPLLFMIGTVFMCTGMFCCAALIGQSTQEQVYQRKHQINPPLASEPTEQQDTAKAGQPSQLFWLQPGNQLVGDETYDAYAYCEDKDKPMQEYITSVKVATPREHLYTWIVIIMTIGGYITQFVGLRGMHAYISLAQLGITVIMSFLRGSLRMQRLTRSANKLRHILDKVTGHELDWLALELCKEETESLGPPEGEDLAQKAGGARSGRQSSPAASTSRLSWYPSGEVRSSLATDIVDATDTSTASQPAEKTLRYRTRLAKLTGHGASFGAYQDWKDEQVHVRAQARRVAKAIRQTAQIVLGDDYTRDIRLSFEIVMGGTARQTTNAELLLQAPRPAERRGWYLDSSVLEGILGLWTWSLKYNKDFDKYDEENSSGTVVAESIRKARIISANLSSDVLCTYGFLDLWLGQSHSQVYEAVISPRNRADCNSMTLWRRTRGAVESNSALSEGKNPSSHSTNFEHWIPTSIPADADPPPKESLQRTTMRFFGWNRVTAWPSTSDEQLHVYYAETDQDLATECGLEIFSYALQALASHSSTERELIRSEGNSKGVAWSNGEISNLCMGLLESGMSDYSSALLCVISGLESLLRMPGDEFDILDLISAAAHYRKMGQWRRAERILQWACGHYSNDERRRSSGNPEARNPISVAYKFAGLGRRRSLRMACTALGELYRWAIADVDRATRSWGSQRLNSMVKNLPRVVEDDKIAQITERYGALGWYLAKARNESSPFAADSESYRDLLSDESELGKLHDISEFAQLLYTYGNERTEGNFAKEVFENDGGEEAGPQLKETPEAMTSTDPTELNGAAKADHVARPSNDERKSWFIKSQRHRTMALIRLSALAKTGHGAALRPLRGIAVSTGWFEVLLAVVEMEEGNTSSTNRDNGIYSSIMLDDVVAARILLPGVESAEQVAQEMGTMVAREGSLGILGLLLDNGIIDPFWADAKGRTILSLAAEGGKVHLVDFLLSLKEVDPDARDNAGRTALSYAAMEGHFPVVNLLVSTGRVDPDSGDHMGHSPLILAILHRGDDATVNALVAEERVNVNLQSTDGDTPVMAAARRSRISVLTQFATLGQNVNTNIRDSQGRTPFLIAVESGHLECARVLVELLRADPTARDYQGRTALFTLVSRARRGDSSDFAMLRYLLQYDGLDLNVQDKKGDTALHSMFSQVHDEDDYASGTLRRLLREQDLDPNIKNRQGRTALHEFVASSRPDIDYHVESFLEHPQVDLATRDRRGQTLLHSAADASNEGVFELLLDSKRIDPHIPDSSGATPLHAAVFACFRSGLSRILEHTLNVDVANERGDTALHLAVKTNNAHAVKTLLMTGKVDPNIRNKQGHTPLHSTMHCLRVDTSITRYILGNERVDVNVADNEGRTVIWATARSFSGYVREFEYNASEDKIAENPAAYARYQKGYEEMRKRVELVWRSSNVAKNHQDKMGRTVLHAAAISGEGIEWIVARGVDPDIEDINGERAIDLAYTAREAERISTATASAGDTLSQGKSSNKDAAETQADPEAEGTKSDQEQEKPDSQGQTAH